MDVMDAQNDAMEAHDAYEDAVPVSERTWLYREYDATEIGG